jgi:hypothetical protein
MVGPRPVGTVAGSTDGRATVLPSTTRLDGKSGMRRAYRNSRRSAAPAPRILILPCSGALGYFGLPRTLALLEATYFVGLRKAGMLEE